MKAKALSTREKHIASQFVSRRPTMLWPNQEYSFLYLGILNDATRAYHSSFSAAFLGLNNPNIVETIGPPRGLEGFQR